MQSQYTEKAATQEHDAIISCGRNVLLKEAYALQQLAENLGSEFTEAINILLQTTGHVVITGVGKSGHIAGKIASTFASTGTKAFFVHPSELAHGDFGMLTEGGTVIAVSNSGETSEISSILAILKRRAITIIGITSNIHSTLAQFCKVVLNLGVTEEACPLKLAPTTSTTATLALGDALAMALMERRHFTVEDFAQLHPGGAIGRKLIKVSDVMRSGTNAIPAVHISSTYQQVLTEISDKCLGLTCVLDDDGVLKGIITDGDLRRSLLKFGTKALSKNAEEMMVIAPKTISQEALATEALRMMEEFRISDLVIVDSKGCPIGIIDLKDLLRAGLY